ncbi:hypothetical protein RHMOL_Rhmol04G0092200 [Rhododendron molle]|uniref:Uncharacterized protein n=1 Tax=Rhododendron molle TaxID=49168 RepID=A0ACC0NYL7_RHOML|nr:hypothetical protein RHMOL_Rhmol04G0092200 [Rhododendron molle]
MSDYIPDELLIEILARLPVASLLRFQSVCKSWYSLITNPGFITKHLSQSIINSKRNGDKLLVRLFNINKERYLLLDDDDKFGDEYLEFEFPFKIPFGYFRVVGSCNGLLCVADDYFTDKPQIIIWNPSTRKSVTLPMAPKTKCPHMCVYGFGSHPATHEYEVIRIQYEMEEFELKLPPKVEIYTQGTRSWRGIRSAAPSYRIVIYMWCQAFVDGVVHWVAYESCVGGGVRNLIMLFNMASESFSEFKLPPTLAYTDYLPTTLSIKKFGQSLAVLCSGPRDTGGCCIWVMKEYGVAESWTKLFSSNLLGMPNKTLGFRRNGINGDYCNNQPLIIIWNPSTRNSVTLPRAPKPQCLFISVYGFGAHPTTQEYKVIRLEYTLESLFKPPLKVEIYTQGTRSWRGVSSAPHYFVAVSWSRAFLNGVVHWVAWDTCEEGGFRNSIMLFNMASESFSEIMLPPTLAYQNVKSLFIHAFGESLAVSCTGESDGGASSIWLMKVYGVAESWTTLFSSEVLGMPNRTLGFRKNGEVFLASDNSLASCAPGTITLASTGIIGTANTFYVDPFMETLVSVE